MTLFYRGAGVGTYWNENDARVTGFIAKEPGVESSLDRVMQHIVQGPNVSPYISLTRSYGVALDYALFGQAETTQTRPGYVYEIELSGALPRGLVIVDPIREIALSASSNALELPYHHDGDVDFLLGVINPNEMAEHLRREAPQAPPGHGTRRPPNLNRQLETMVRALRDAEVLALGAIPASCVRARYDIR